MRNVAGRVCDRSTTSQGIDEGVIVAIRSFSVGARRGLVAAAADDVPNLLAIAGPNGSGKSALLEQLWQQRTSLLEPSSEALYVGPNRTWRAGPLTDLAARAFTQDYEQVLKAESLPGFQYVAPGGFNFLSGMSRFGSNADDAQALVKTSIVRIGNRAENFIAQEYRRQGGKIEQGTVPDLLAPFAEMVEILLPHLQFVKIDPENQNNISVLFRAKDPNRASVAFDIDELSSGEKAAIALFLPFIERQIRSLTGESSVSPTEGVVPLTVLFDEPEIHLHPLLQLNVLEYMRGLAARNEAQFIFTTHSPTLLDALEPRELFLLSPASVAPDNQLSRLSESYEKLEVARAVTGATHILTRGKPIVFVEGEPDTGTVATDQRLLRLLVRDAEHWAVVPAHGKSQVLRAVKDMRSAQLALPGLPVFGLVDGDQGSDTSDDHVIAWPVAMIENLLLDPIALHAVLEPYGQLILRSPEDIEGTLREIAASRVDDETRIRIRTRLPSSTLRPDGIDPDQIAPAIKANVENYLSKLSEIDLKSVVEQARDEVAQIQTSGRELERFRGKEIMKSFYKKHQIDRFGLGWNAFLTETARQASGSQRTRSLSSQPIQQIRLFFPKKITELLDAMPEGDPRDRLADQCREERLLWEQGTPRAKNREALRADLLHLARGLRASGNPVGDELIRHAVAVGTAS